MLLNGKARPLRSLHKLPHPYGSYKIGSRYSTLSAQSGSRASVRHAYAKDRTFRALAVIFINCQSPLDLQA